MFVEVWNLPISLLENIDILINPAFKCLLLQDFIRDIISSMLTPLPKNMYALFANKGTQDISLPLY